MAAPEVPQAGEDAPPKTLRDHASEAARAGAAAAVAELPPVVAAHMGHVLDEANAALFARFSEAVLAVGYTPPAQCTAPTDAAGGVGDGSSAFEGAMVLDEAALEDCISRLSAWAAACDADATVLRRFSAEGGGQAADVLVRRRAAKAGGGSDSAVAGLTATRAAPLEVRVAVVGNVDSGKSTLVGVLTRNCLDDGRGAARQKVFKHAHETESGRTSSIGQHTLCLDSHGTILNDSTFRNAACGETVAKSSKVVTLVDLAGHERYFKTTAFGLTGHLPDYACIMVGANAGVIGMCKEHLGIALALKVPVFFVVTKIDIAPDHVLKHTLSQLNSVLKKPGVRKMPVVVRTQHDLYTCIRHAADGYVAPIFLTSAVTGHGLDLVRAFFNLLPLRTEWGSKVSEPAEFIIDETFSVPGVGTVVAGTVKQGVIGVNSGLLLGPDPGDGTFKPAAVKSIHYKRLPVAQVQAGQTAALALKKVKRTAVQKGMVLADSSLHPEASWEFDADIAILTHSTTIQPKYQAVIHCEIIRQAARVVDMDREQLRSGDRSRVRFRFLIRPEYLTVGARFVFREGRTKGIGVVRGK